MGLPARRAYPRISVDPAVEIPRTAVADAGAGARGDEPFDLQTIVEAVFDPTEERVIYELQAGQTAVADTEDRLTVAAGEAVPAALACAAALRRLGQRRFVVAVVSAESAQQALSELVRPCDGELKRIVLVALSGPGSPWGMPPAVESSWRVIDLRALSSARSVAKTLIAARYDESPTVVVVDERVGMWWDGLHRGRLPVARVQQARRGIDLSAALAAEFKLLMTVDPRVSAVVLVNDPEWEALSSISGVPAPMTDRRLDRGLMTALGLAHAGCHPVIVVRSGDVAADSTTLCRRFAGREFRGTLVVLDSDAESEVSVEWPAAWEHRVLTPDMDVSELRRASADCVNAVRGTVLHVPGARATRAAENGAARPDSDKTRVRRTVRRDGGVTAGPVLVPVPDPREPEVVDFQGALSDTFLRWVEEYERVGRRGRYLWNWCQTGLEAIALSCVDPRYQSELVDTKLISVMYGVMLDDVADEMHDPQLLEWLGVGSKDPAARDFRVCPAERRAYAELTFRIWDEYESRVRSYPRYREFERLLRYDNDQVLNTMRYSSLVNEHSSMINTAEHDAYAPHNMQMMTFATVDLMCSPGFELPELGVVRAAMWHAQCMGRIGNMVSTWERELRTGDLTSGVLARLVETGELSPEDLQSGRTGEVRKAVTDSAIEQFFLGEWQRHRTSIEAMVSQVSSVDLRRLISGLDRLIRMELGSRGLK